MLMDYALPPVAAVLLWWLGTGAVILLDRMPRDSAAWTFGIASLFTAAAVLCIAHTAGDRSVAGAYAAFTCAVVLWGWHELAFLSGWITGPRRLPATLGARGARRLREAVQVLLWHELALLVTLVALWAWLGRSSNPTAAWTFTLLYAMRVSAKLNLFLGVRNLALDFLPPHLHYLGSYFRQRRFNALLPWSVLAGCVAIGFLVAGAQATTAGQQAAHLLLASLLALAVVEHLMMVLPLEPSALWRWALRRPVEARP
jgi:putative photosynthetic complex assembly protein 2